MAEPIHHQTIELLLKAIHPEGDTLLSSFMFGKPGAPIWERRFGTELYADRKVYTRALLFIRQNGAAHLHAISISELWSMVTNFLTENFWFIGHSSAFLKYSSPYSDYVSARDKASLAEALQFLPYLTGETSLRYIH
ncbi:hypothetical protein [Methylorubrum extorquens]|uniref:hypothetical protein n=1 Tax=Methylorubrum extorquens TaxID=408 RepID=UPI0012379861|nr:hypothetical protein [Methylorubrum extorquens]WIU38596.1 hypothetical protein KQ926_18615 [Methylorubrum extorquens]